MCIFTLLSYLPVNFISSPAIILISGCRKFVEGNSRFSVNLVLSASLALFPHWGLFANQALWKKTKYIYISVISIKQSIFPPPHLSGHKETCNFFAEYIMWNASLSLCILTLSYSLV